MQELLPSVRLYCTLVVAGEVWVAYTGSPQVAVFYWIEGGWAAKEERAACPPLQVLLVLCGLYSCLSWLALALSDGGSCRRLAQGLVHSTSSACVGTWRGGLESLKVLKKSITPHRFESHGTEHDRKTDGIWKASNRRPSHGVSTSHMHSRQT